MHIRFRPSFFPFTEPSVEVDMSWKPEPDRRGWPTSPSSRRPWISVAPAVIGVGLDLEWDMDCWPYVWYSMEAGRPSRIPLVPRAYFLALTPCTSWPAHGLYDARRVSATTLWIEPGAARTSHLTVSVHP